MESSALVTSDIGPFAIIPRWVLLADITPISVRLYCVLADMAHRQTGNTAYPSRQYLAKRGHCSLRSVAGSLKELKELGAIKIQHRKKAGGLDTSMYTVITAHSPALPWEESAPTPGASVAQRTRTTLEQESSASSEDSTTPLPQPRTPADFYAAEKMNDQIAIMVEIATANGRQVDGGRIAGLLKRYPGNKAGVMVAFMDAIARNVAVIEDYAEGVLKNGARQTRREPARSRQAVATKRELAWAQKYADAETDELAPPDGWEIGDPVPVGSAREPA